MAKQDLNIGAAPNDGTGDPLRDAMDKVNDNFGELYTALGGNTVSNLVSGGVIDFTGANKITFLYNDVSDLPAASSYHGMFAHAHTQGAAYYAHAGSWIQLADKSQVDNLSINSLTDVDTATTAPTNGQVLAWNSTNSEWEPQSAAGGVALGDFSVSLASAGNSSLAYNANNGVFTFTPPDLTGYAQLSDFSVGTEAAASGDGGIVYNSSNGTFTYTPPDLSSYQTIAGLATVATTGQYTDLLSTPTIPSTLTDLGITDGNAGQFLTTDGSGAFSFATVSGGGYADSDVDTHLNTSTATAGQILSWTGTDYDWIADATGGGGASVTISDTAPGSASAGDLWWESDTGILKIYYTDADSSQWVDATPQGSGGSSYSNTNLETYLNGNLATNIIPDTNAAYDIGSAEYKIRHLYLSDTSLYMGDNEVAIGLTNDKLTIGGHHVAESSHANVDNAGVVDITKTNHLVTPLVAGVTLPDGTYIGQELKFWIANTVGNDYIDITVDNAKYMNGSGTLVTATAYTWRLQATNTAMFGCLWDGAAWILSNGSIGA